MDILFAPKKIKEVNIIASKSFVHRTMIALALSKGYGELMVGTVSKDMQATANVLNALGYSVRTENNKIIVMPENIHVDKPSINCGESGSTARFMISVAAALYDEYFITGEGSLLNRPFKELIDCLKEKGIEFDSDNMLPFNVKGSLIPGTYTIPGNISSQYITGLLLALPLLREQSYIKVLPPVESVDYIEITLSVLNDFGINITKENLPDGGIIYSIPSDCRYIAPRKVSAEGDWSNAAFFLTMGALLEEGIMVKGLNPYSLQGDRQIVEILKQFGAIVNVSDDCVLVKKGKLQAVELDISPIPDLAPVICVLACFAEGETILRNAERLRIKESDRILSTKQLVEKTGGLLRTEERDGHTDIYVKATERPDNNKQIVIDSFNDHRIVMSAAVAALGLNRPVLIKSAEAVNKSYPGFFDVFN